jgi:hypothetical protein
MKREFATALSFAATVAISAALLSPSSLRAQASSPSGAMQVGTLQMVSARVAVKDNLDANKAKPGDQIRTTLAKKVSLENGTLLPAGTTIVGVVAADDTKMAGKTKLALDFNKAELKNGKTIALKATIVGIYPAESDDIDGHPIAPGDEMTDTWNGRPNAVDEIDALPGVDLHSAVSSNNSGVLVSSKRDVKLKYGTEIALAVAAAPASAGGE